jgi:hypothetical protein
MKIVLKFGIDHFWSSHISEMVMSPGTPVSSTNKTDHHDITKILLKVSLNTITLNNILGNWFM